jgi:hypothetical protein
MCEACGKREAWAKNLKHPICAECAVRAWQKLSEDANAAQPSAQADGAICRHDFAVTDDVLDYCIRCGETRPRR